MAKKHYVVKVGLVVLVLLLIIFISRCSQQQPPSIIVSPNQNLSLDLAPNISPANSSINITVSVPSIDLDNGRAPNDAGNASYIPEPEFSQNFIEVIPVCANITNSVCGSDGKTYQNACFAKLLNVTITKQVACDKTLIASNNATFVDTSKCDKEATFVVCGVTSTGKSITSKNRCMAQLLKAVSITDGACPISN